MSPEFAEEAALCLAANGIRAYIFPSLRPTPMLSFALRELGCTAGIVVTASHNPPEYNGYKVYWEDGAQITFPRDREIISEVNAITDYSRVRTMTRQDAEEAGLSRAITEEYGTDLIETLTGFKYIGEQIKFFEQNHRHEYVFGYEESYGCLIGTHARDKDAVAAVMALCETAAWCRRQGRTLCGQMENLYQRYGYFREGLSTITLKRQEGVRKIGEIMERIRKEVPEQIGGFPVTRFRDYREDVLLDLAAKEKGKTGLPKSNVLYFEMGKDAWCCVRPSGTEPKIKFYIGVKGESEEAAEKMLQKLSEALQGFAG